MDSGKRYEIVLRDLESLVQKRLGPETRLLNYDTSPFVKEGENWGSTLLKLQATIEKSAEDKEPTELNLAAKMMPPTDIQRQTFQSLFTFKKEIFLYEELLPKYEEVLGERLDIVPTFFGSRLSLKPDSDEVDDDAVILMENMKLKGYYMTDRFQGLDLEHTRAVITTLAKFHAIGISIKHRAPEFLPRIEKFSKAMVTGVEATRPMLDMVLTAIKGDPEIGPEFYEKIKATCDPADLSTYYTQLAVDHPWACVVHNDLWNNNVLLHKNAEGHVDDCKLVDFQTYYTSSPLTDLVFLLCTSSRTPHEYFDEIVETYRAEAARVLSKLDCPEALELFTPEKFDERLRLDASGELFHVIEFTKIVEQREGESYEETPPNEHTMRRLRSIFKVYKRKQWI